MCVNVYEIVLKCMGYLLNLQIKGMPYVLIPTGIHRYAE